MTTPNPQLQKAVLAVLRAHSGASIVGGPGSNARVWDDVPSGPTFPYVEFGENQVIPDKGDGGYSGAEVNMTLRGWSTKSTREEAQNLAAWLERALDGAEAALNASGKLTGHRVVAADFVRSDIIDSDTGPDKQAVCRFRFLTEPTT